MASRITLHCILCFFICMGSLLCQQHQAQSTRRRSVPEQPPGNLYDMKRLLQNLETIRTVPTKLNEAILINNLKKGQLSFQPTPEDFDTLRKAGASEELIKVISEKAGMPEPPAQVSTPPEPPKPKEGRLTITCKPIDCEVSIDNKQIGKTTKNELKDVVLPEGKVTVAAVAKDHNPDKQGQVVEITDNTTSAVEFTFTVNPNALLEKGRELFDGMITALGGEAALKQSGFFTANGSLEIVDHSKGNALWLIKTTIKLPGKARIETSKSNKKYTIWKAESGFVWDPSPKGGKEFDDLEDALRNLTDYHIVGLVNLLQGSGASVQAERLHYEPGEKINLLVQRESYTYRVALDAQSRPQEILHQSGGLNAGLRILLGDFTRYDKVFIPLKTEVVSPSAEKRGVIMKYDTVTVNPQNVREEVFSPKKGLRIRGR